jgi:type II secretory pathway component PulC
MRNKILIILLIFIFIFLNSISVLAETTKQEIYSGKKFRNPFVEFADPEPVPEEPAKSETETEENGEENQLNSNDSAENDSAQAQKQEPELPRITAEDIKRELPFSLSGIISSNKEKVALLSTGGNVEFIRGNYEQNGYQIIAIEKESVIVQNRGVKLRLKIGGEVDEI